MAIGTTAALLGGAALSAGASVVGAGKSAKAVSGAADKSTKLQADIYNDVRELQEPFYGMGSAAVNPLLYELGLTSEAPMIGGSPAEIEVIPGSGGGAGTVGQGFDAASRENSHPLSPLMGAMLMGRSSDQLSQMAQNDPDARRYLQAGGHDIDARGELVSRGGSAAAPTMYKVGDQTFASRAAAEEHAAANPSGGKQYQGYQMSPMAQYLLEEGVDTIEAGAAMRGGLNSGATLKALDDYRGNLVKSDRDAYLNRLFGLVGIGQNAAAQQGNAGQNYAANAGNTMMQAGQAQAQGITNATNAINSGIGNFASIYGYMNPMQNYAQGFQGGAPGAGGLY